MGDEAMAEPKGHLPEQQFAWIRSADFAEKGKGKAENKKGKSNKTKPKGTGKTRRSTQNQKEQTDIRLSRRSEARIAFREIRVVHPRNCCSWLLLSVVAVSCAALLIANARIGF